MKTCDTWHFVQLVSRSQEISGINTASGCAVHQFLLLLVCVPRSGGSRFSY